MTTDYIVASLPTLAFDAPPGITAEKFLAQVPGWAGELMGCGAASGEESGAARHSLVRRWRDLETQLRNAAASCRANGAKWTRPAEGCSVYWRGRVAACFQEKDVARRTEMIDRVWWDAAGELAPPASPLGEGALAAYAVRLGIALKRAGISRDRGLAVFDAMAKAGRLDF